MKNCCLLHDILYIEFAVGNGLKNKIGSEKPVVMNSKIDIQLVSAKYFFQMAPKKKIQGLFVDIRQF